MGMLGFDAVSMRELVGNLSFLLRGVVTDRFMSR